jgi:hypothetical protein
MTDEKYVEIARAISKEYFNKLREVNEKVLKEAEEYAKKVNGKIKYTRFGVVVKSKYGTTPFYYGDFLPKEVKDEIIAELIKKYHTTTK